MFRKKLFMYTPKIIVNQEEIEVKIQNQNLQDSQYVIDQNNEVEIVFNLNCKMNFEDTQVEIDFQMSHGQMIPLHFKKNCFNKEKNVKNLISVTPKPNYLQKFIENELKNNRGILKKIWEFL